MFLLLGRYTAPTEAVDAHRDAHVAWVQEHSAAGHFLAGAIENGGAGGCIVALAASLADVEGWTQADPFVNAGVFEYDIRQYEVAFAADSVAGLEG